ncbi:DNA adenine methylase [Pseudonocardia benzenivorans]
MTAPPFAYFGGKTTLAQRIVELIPPHEHYVEPFAGGLSVLLAKRPSVMETVNDLDGRLMTFWRVLRERLPELERACALTPHSRAEYETCQDVTQDPLDDELETARRVWVRLSQGRGGTQRRTGWRTYQAPAARASACPATSRPTSVDSPPRPNASRASRSRTGRPSTSSRPTAESPTASSSTSIRHTSDPPGPDGTTSSRCPARPSTSSCSPR